MVMDAATMNMKMFTTPDLPLAATLVSSGQTLIAIERSNPKRAGFSFAQNREVNVLVQRYHAGTLRVEPRTYFDAVRHIKNRLYGG